LNIRGLLAGEFPRVRHWLARPGRFGAAFPNGVNNHNLDLPDYNGEALNLITIRGNGPPYFNVAAFSENALGAPSNALRRSFFRPGEINFDLALLKTMKFTESKTFELRVEAFNAFNHTNFFGPAAINRDVDNGTLFGRLVNVAPPRLMQATLKLVF